MKIPQPELSLHEYWTNWHAIPTCLSYAALYDFLAQEFTNNDVFVEVGGLLGKSATYMARKTIELRKDNTIILVDNLYGVEGDITMYTSIGQAKQAHALYTNFVATGVEKRLHSFPTRRMPICPILVQRQFGLRYFHLFTPFRK